MSHFEMLARDVRYAARVLWKSPVFATTAILTLGLCIGANTAIYTVVDRVLLRPLPYPQPDRLAQIVRHAEGPGVNDDETGQAGVTWVARGPRGGPRDGRVRQSAWSYLSCQPPQV